MNSIELFSFILSSLALVLVIIVFMMNLFEKLRKHFPASVNCWFCNFSTEVPYENRNRFECPSCLQYNGFNQDGGYNRIIEAQYNENLNRRPLMRQSPKSFNGFCEPCNHNQQLKIKMLADFTPFKESNYDLEIEHFRNQLEKAYQLCKYCRRVLKMKLLKDKATVLGKHVFNIQAKSFSLIQSKTPSSLSQSSVKIIKSIQGTLAFCLVLNIISHYASSLLTIENIPKFVLPYLEVFQDLHVLISNLILDFISFTFTLDISKYSYCFGLLLQLVSVPLDNSTTTIKMNQILCWSFITLTYMGTTTEATHFSIHLFQLLCASLIFYSSFFEKRKHTHTGFKKLKRSDDNIIECSDEESEVSFRSAKMHSSFQKDSLFNHSPIFLQKTDQNNEYTARNNTSVLYSNIRNGIEGLHLDSRFGDNSSPISSFSRSESPRVVLSPPKLKTVTQNSWVAGGFWRNEDGSIIMPVHDATTLSRSSSQSSGFGSQINDNGFGNNPFNSLPASRKNSICGDNDRCTLASEPPYHFQSISPHPTWRNSLINTSSSPKFHNSLGVFKSTSSNFNEFVLPPVNRLTTPMPLYKTKGLFKLAQTDCNSPDIFARKELNQSTNSFY